LVTSTLPFTIALVGNVNADDLAKHDCVHAWLSIPSRKLNGSPIAAFEGDW